MIVMMCKVCSFFPHTVFGYFISFLYAFLNVSQKSGKGKICNSVLYCYNLKCYLPFQNKIIGPRVLVSLLDRHKMRVKCFLADRSSYNVQFIAYLCWLRFAFLLLGYFRTF